MLVEFEGRLEGQSYYKFLYVKRTIGYSGTPLSSTGTKSNMGLVGMESYFYDFTLSDMKGN